MVKVTDASMKDIKTALADAGIEVRSILVVHKEETGSDQPEEGSEGDG
jgi:hypothetical protein